ncbi:MAG: pyrroline-5-carboxylate reductase [Fibrobacterales bacterium]|nr:pyrroline-5-carboxylate reductase [Fibrobacterales bacterium]MBP5350517.1 pyrroline-5-carboxylate reductase [Fibrobacterales bacterium]
MKKIAFVGAGQMGGAFLEGLAATGKFECAFAEPNDARAEELAKKTGAKRMPVADAVAFADVVVLAVKPQVFPKVAPEVAAALAKTSGKTVVSLMAGIQRAKLRAALGDGAVLVRTMPNLPLVVKGGAVAVASDDVPAEIVDEVVGLFAHVGSAMAVPESQLDAVTGLSGSGPAWVFQFVEGLAAGGVQAGLARPVAEELALATIEGSVKMLRAKMGGTGDLTAKVCSPAGTTVYGLKVLESAGFRGTLMDAVVAAAERSKELGAK